METLGGHWMNLFEDNRDEKEEWWERKQQLYKKRRAKIIRIQGNGNIYQTIRYDQITTYYYLLFLSFFIKQNGYYYLEERVTPYEFQVLNGEINNHKETYKRTNRIKKIPSLNTNSTRLQSNQRFEYDRIAAVNYAEYWWNSYNPEFKNFSVDCTNFISQCLLAGGAPMRGMPTRDQGWWYTNKNWSYSWAVAHSLRWYLSGSRIGLKGKEVQLASELGLGDVICYDFQGDNRWDHTTIVVAKDAENMPLVNAHTDNSRHRYWSYEDSTAWTPNIQYKFFRIGES